jgi:hypothetical protein
MSQRKVVYARTAQKAAHTLKCMPHAPTPAAAAACDHRFKVGLEEDVQRAHHARWMQLLAERVAVRKTATVGAERPRRTQARHTHTWR